MALKWAGLFVMDWSHKKPLNKGGCQGLGAWAGPGQDPKSSLYAVPMSGVTITHFGVLADLGEFQNLSGNCGPSAI